MTKIVQKRPLNKCTKSTHMTKIHMGQLIKQVFDERGYSTAELAALIHCDRTNIYRIFNRSSIDSELLDRISKALSYDFMQAYSTNNSAKPKIKTSFTIEIDGSNVIISAPSDVNILVKKRTQE